MCDIPGPISMVEIKNLQLPHPITCENVWGLTKDQPGSVSVTLLLQPGFAAAATEDTLDQSVHYGDLAKAIRKSMSGPTEPLAMLESVERCSLDLGRREKDDKNIVSLVVTELVLPKASMTGDHLAFTNISRVKDGVLEPDRKQFVVKDMRLMVLVGLNDYERSDKQPIVATLILHYDESDAQSGSKAVDQKTAFMLERLARKTLESGTFGTLEAMANDAIARIRQAVQSVDVVVPTIQLRLEKPKAIPFADAAVIDVLMRASDNVGRSTSPDQPKDDQTVPKPEPQAIKVIRPYI